MRRALYAGGSSTALGLTVNAGGLNGWLTGFPMLAVDAPGTTPRGRAIVTLGANGGLETIAPETFEPPSASSSSSGQISYPSKRTSSPSKSA